MTPDIGELERAGDGWRLRYVRRYAHPAEKVWRAITEPEHLASWFPNRITGEFTANGSLVFHFDGHDIDDMPGTVLAIDPPRLLEYSWGPDTLRFELEADGDGCVLTFSDTIAEIGKAARDGAGWHVCLDSLAAELDGIDTTTLPDELNPKTPAAWKLIHPHYVSGFPAEASTEGPPEGMSDYTSVESPPSTAIV